MWHRQNICCWFYTETTKYYVNIIRICNGRSWAIEMLNNFVLYADYKLHHPLFIDKHLIFQRTHTQTAYKNRNLIERSIKHLRISSPRPRTRIQIDMSRLMYTQHGLWLIRIDHTHHIHIQSYWKRPDWHVWWHAGNEKSHQIQQLQTLIAEANALMLCSGTLMLTTLPDTQTIHSTSINIHICVDGKSIFRM